MHADTPPFADAEDPAAVGGALGPEALHQVTLALVAARQGEPGAVDELFRLVYAEICELARERLGRQGRRGTLDTTAVVHEAYLKIVRHGQMHWQDRAHFLAVAATAMRQVLLDRARRHLAAKRGGGAVHVPLDEAADAATAGAGDLLALDAALTRLAAADPQLARVVEMRFFGGLSVEETAQALGVSEATVKRAWRKARAILHCDLAGGPEA
ncbi:MAG: sigma-70 family RNA polymerase sigma factor [Krumholzibacteria bacterium]|nr:sigma-70 family RNA polymerase sigma factor [Candidatus Krumholzibacteria bacterium]